MGEIRIRSSSWETPPAFDEFADMFDKGSGSSDTLLHAAVRTSYCTVKEVKELLRLGCEVNRVNNHHRTALHELCKNDHCSAEIVKTLLDNGADPNAMDTALNTPLHYFVSSRSCDLVVVQELLNRGAMLDSRNWLLRTPLHYSCQCRVPNVHVVKELLRCGADPNVKDWKDNTPLHYFIRTHQEDVVKELIQYGANIASRNCWRETPLHCAMKSPFNMNNVQILLFCGAQPNARDNMGSTPLHLAAKSYKYCNELVSLLLENGARYHVLDWRSFTPVHYIAGNDCYVYPSLCKLLDQGADVNGISIDRATPLQAAVRRRFVSYTIVKELVKRGTNLRAQDLFKLTPLAQVAKNLHFSAVVDNKSHLSVFRELLHATTQYKLKSRHLRMIVNYLTLIADSNVRIASYKLLIKYCVLLHMESSSILTKKLRSLEHELSVYRKSCMNEYKKMSCNFLCLCSSYDPPTCCSSMYASELLVYDVLCRQSCPISLVHKILAILYKNTYPIYSDILVHALPKHLLVIIVMNKGFPPSVSDDGLKVSLNEECARRIMSFLSKEDILNLLKAIELKEPDSTTAPSLKRKNSGGSNNKLGGAGIKRPRRACSKAY